MVCPAQRICDFTFFGFSKNLIVVNIYCVMISLIYGLTFSDNMVVWHSKVLSLLLLTSSKLNQSIFRLWTLRPVVLTMLFRIYSKARNHRDFRFTAGLAVEIFIIRHRLTWHKITGYDLQFEILTYRNQSKLTKNWRNNWPSFLWGVQIMMIFPNVHKIKNIDQSNQLNMTVFKLWQKLL